MEFIGNNFVLIHYANNTGTFIFKPEFFIELTTHNKFTTHCDVFFNCDYFWKDMFEFLAYIVAPLAATYVFGYRQMMEHGDAADRLDKLKELSEKIWSDAIAGKNAVTLKLKSRTLQDQIFDHRKKNPPIFDFVFRWFRDGDEVLMNKGAEALVREYLNAPSR